MRMIAKALAILSPNQNAYSETFIQAHKDLPFEIKFYHSGRLPTQLEGRYDLTNFSRIEKFKKKIFKKFTDKEYGLYYSLKRENVACVLAEYAPTACDCLQVIKTLQLPLIVHFHGYDASVNTVLQNYHEKYLSVFKYAYTVIAVSKKMKEKLIEMGCPVEKIILCTYGANPIFFTNKPCYSKQQFIFVGRFAEKKAPHLTVKAFKKVTANFPEATLVMAGDGDLLSCCKQLAADLQLADKIIFTGALPPEKIRKLMEESVAFVQHSVTAESGDSEGTPVAILEAQAAALPVVSTYHAGIPDVVVHNQTGFLVNEHDVEAMAVYMCKLLDETALANRMGNCGRKRIREHFTMEKNLSTLTEIIKEAISGNN
jgi:colanic acid/amylovoran biosynthesis glycosyltransferase